MANHKITQKDIAEALGLSLSTVSKVFNGSKTISAKVHTVVIKKAIEMGYKNVNPEMLKELEPAPLSDGTVAFCCRRNEMTGEYWPRIIRGVENALRKAGISLMLCITDLSEEEKPELPSALTNMPHKGIITLAKFPKEYYRKINDLGLPWISIDTAPDMGSPNIMSDIVTVNNSEAVWKITERLIRQGHTEIAFVGDVKTSLAYRERWEGYARAMREADIALKEKFCITSPRPKNYFDFEAELKEPLSEIAGEVTAIVCAADVIALYIVHYLSGAGYRVPEDICVSGFDDIKESGRTSLTSVKNYPEHVGNKAGEQLLSRIADAEQPLEIIRIETQVLFRDSTNKVM